MSFLATCVWISVFMIPVEGDHCGIAKDLGSMTERVVGYVLKQGENIVNDGYLSEDWYRMTGYTLAQSTKTCGTGLNWYMKGTLPAVGKSGRVTVCANDGLQCPSQFSKTIEVETCPNNDYIFKLTKTDSSKEAYCIEPLPGTKASKPAPDISYVQPQITYGIKLTHNTSIPEELEHFCDFTVKPEHKTFHYTVEWSLSDGSSVAKQLSIGTATKDDETTFKDTTKLTETHLNLNGIVKFPYTIVCSVKAKQDATGSYSHVQKSGAKFCGIQILTSPVLRIKDTEKADINLTLTVPFGCNDQVRKISNGIGCAVDLTLFVPDSSNFNQRCEIFNLANLNRENKPCGIRIKNDEVGKVKTISVLNKFAGQSNEKIQQFDVLLQTNSYHLHSMISNYRLEPVTIISSVDSTLLSDRKCYAYSDPHMMTFDGTSYENQALGTFLMYRNNKFNTEVQIRTRKCPNYNSGTDKPYCNEAVAVRAGRDVYVVDIKHHDTNFMMCDDRVLHDSVRREKGSGSSFRVFLPTGTEIHINKGTVYGKHRVGYEYFVEVTIHPGLDDLHNTEGLCGKFDYNKHNDLNRRCYIPKKANLCWRKDHASFSDLFDATQRQSLTPYSQEVKLCTCECPNDNCGSTSLKTSFTCSAKTTKTCGIESLPRMNSAMCHTQRSKRDIHTSHETDSDVEHDGVFANHIVNNKAMEQWHRLRRSLSDEQDANDACRSAMNTTSVQMCSSIPGFDLESYINNCALDAMASNSMEWTQIHIEAVKKNCIKQVEFNQPIPQDILAKIIVPTDDDNGTYGHDNDTNGNDTTWETTTFIPTTVSNKQSFIFTRDLLTQIKEVSCINDCNENGKCIKGVCVCDPGYFDDDCSVDINIAPTMFGIPDRGKCDLTQRECKMTAVKGGTFVDTTDLYCRLKPFMVKTDGQVATTEPVTVRATFDSFLQVFCPFPKSKRVRRSTGNPTDNVVASGYKVAVSNNGIRETGFSADDSIIIYDSNCVDCQKQKGSIRCSVLPGYCTHNGHCYNRGDQIGCYSCLGDAPDEYHWTPGKDCGNKMSDSSSSKLWIIGATIGPLAAVIVISVTICIRMKQRRKLKKKMGSTITPMGSLNPIVVTPNNADKIQDDTATPVSFPSNYETN